MRSPTRSTDYGRSSRTMLYEVTSPFSRLSPGTDSLTAFPPSPDRVQLPGLAERAYRSLHIVDERGVGPAQADVVAEAVERLAHHPDVVLARRAPADVERVVHDGVQTRGHEIAEELDHGRAHFEAAAPEGVERPLDRGIVHVADLQVLLPEIVRRVDPRVVRAHRYHEAPGAVRRRGHDRVGGRGARRP